MNQEFEDTPTKGKRLIEVWGSDSRNIVAVYLIAESETTLFKVPYESWSRDFDFSFFYSDPVYVEKTLDGQERISYKSSKMELNKMYPIEWNGEKYGLMKTKKDVEVFKFHPEL